jgi:pre-mRNA-processing factor SLU7
MGKKYHGIINVREREDPAKYLLNLDLNSAQFNPKSRSMNENPNPLLPNDKQRFKGDNEFNETGDKLQLIEQEKFALEQAELRNSELNAVALPSLTAHVFKTVRQNNKLLNSGRTGELLKRYGGEEYINNMPEQLTET